MMMIIINSYTFWAVAVVVVDVIIWISDLIGWIYFFCSHFFYIPPKWPIDVSHRSSQWGLKQKKKKFFSCIRILKYIWRAVYKTLEKKTTTTTIQWTGFSFQNAWFSFLSHWWWIWYNVNHSFIQLLLPLIMIIMTMMMMWMMMASSFFLFCLMTDGPVFMSSNISE